MNYKIQLKETYLYALFQEVWGRTAYVVLCFSLALSTCFCHSIELFYILLYPILNQGKKLFFIDLTEALSATLQICFIAALTQTVPFLLYHFWCYFVAGRYPWERKRLALSGLSLAISSLPAGFALYCCILPDVCQFLINFEITTPALTVELESRIYTYITLLVRLLLLLGVLYYLPWLLLLLIRCRLLTGQPLAGWRLWFAWFAALSAASVSPPTFTSQFVLSLLLASSYEFVVLFGCYHQRVTARFELRNPLGG